MLLFVLWIGTGNQITTKAAGSEIRQLLCAYMRLILKWFILCRVFQILRNVAVQDKVSVGGGIVVDQMPLCFRYKKLLRMPLRRG